MAVVKSREGAAALTDALLEDGVQVVVVEGDFLSERARGEFVSHLGAAGSVRFVTLDVSLATALVRVKQDPTRGISRDPAFLTRHYQALTDVIRERAREELCLDTAEVTAEEAAKSIACWSVAATR